MLLLIGYKSKKELKQCVGKSLRYRETSVFGDEYKQNGKFVAASRPSMGGAGREFFAEITMQDGKIARVA